MRLAVARASYIPVGTIQPRQCAAGGFSMISRRLALVRTTSFPSFFFTACFLAALNFFRSSSSIAHNSFFRATQ